MIERCTDDKSKDFQNYGGRGITVCERWLSFENFLADMEPTFTPGLTIERKDVDGNYEPTNCCWATTKEQGRNKRKSVFIETPWGRMTIAEAAERAGINRATLKTRLLQLGWPFEKAILKKKFHRSRSWRQEESI